MTPAQKITPCLWFDSEAEEAARFYVSVFRNGRIGKISRYGKEGFEVHRRPEGSVMTVEFELEGERFTALNGGPHFKHSEAFSFQIATDDQAETDRLWNAIVGNGGQESECGWCKDKWGLSWQITPRALIAAITDPDRAAARRAFDAMMTMRKIDIARIEAARRG